MDSNFWKRLESFIQYVEVNDEPGKEEKEYILTVAKEQQKTNQ